MTLAARDSPIIPDPDGSSVLGHLANLGIDDLAHAITTCEEVFTPFVVPKEDGNEGKCGLGLIWDGGPREDTGNAGLMLGG